MTTLNRTQKIDLLTGIQKGVRSIAELLPVTYEVWDQAGDDGSYLQEATGVTLNSKEFAQYKKQLPKNVVVIQVNYQ